MYYDWTESPVGDLLIVAGETAVTRIRFRKETHSGEVAEDWRCGGPVVAAARRQLDEYFEGRRTCFDLPVALSGTPFQLRAWEALQRIPYGATRSYGEQARAMGRPRAVRAAGAANRRNPIVIVVPCHRVIGGDGRLTGYGGGLDIKEYLLELEQRHVNAAGRATGVGRGGTGPVRPREPGGAMRLEDRVARAVTGPGRVPSVTPAVDDSQVSVPPMSMRMCIASP